jgi:integrase
MDTWRIIGIRPNTPKTRAKTVPKIHFTDIVVKNLRPGVYFDSRTPSFGIRVGKSRKTWLVLRGANRTKVRLGQYPHTSLQDARRKALVALGTPFQRSTAPNFPEALDLFLAQDKWRPRSKYVLEHCLRYHFNWKRPLDKITHEDVAQVIEGIKGKSAAAHALKDIRAFFNWSVPRYLSHSPCVGLKMPTYAPRQRVLTDDELKRVWNAVDQIGAPFATIIRLLILTGQRKTEIGTLKWGHVTDGSITLPETKNGRQHTFPLGPLAGSLLNRGLSSSTSFCFPAPGKPSVPYNGWGYHLAQLLALSKTSDWTLHDLRRTFATNLAALGTPIHVTERLLNHVSGTQSGIVAVYQRHSYWDEQTAAIQKWEAKLASNVKQ